MRGMRTMRLVVVALLGSAALFGCGSSDDGADGGAEQTTSTTKAGVAAEPSLQPAGSDLAEGLVVPEGTQLAGTVFAQPSEVDGVDDWSAYLVIDDDPFAAWDDLAAQLREGDPAAQIAGSADACVWTIDDDAVLEPEAGQGAPVGEPTGEPTTGDAVAPRSTAEATGSAPTTTEAPAADPYIEAVTITADPPIDEVDGVECNASASSTGDGARMRYTVALRGGARKPATITLEARAEPPAAMTVPPWAWRIELEAESRQGESYSEEPGPEPVPPAASEHVPPALERETPAEGGPFGTEVNCFVGKGYDQILLPDGAAFVAGGFSDGSDSVLAVDDADAAIAYIQQQTAGDGTSEDGPGTIEQLELADGGEVTDFSFGISGGGGGCGATSSADGRFLLVSVHGD